MALSNPFIVLSYVGGPALLTNATTLFVLSTSNRFARAVDRSRFLVDRLSDGDGIRPFYREEIPEVHRRVLLIGRALVCFYLAAACFALATLGSISGAVLAEATNGPPTIAIIIAAVLTGIVGFCAFIAGAAMLTMESRTAVRSLLRESDEALLLAARKDV
jgi:MFS family permease